jgi:hypothetical protein
MISGKHNMIFASVQRNYLIDVVFREATGDANPEMELA